MDSMIMVRTSYCPHSSFGPTSPASTNSEFQEQAGPGGAHTVFFNCATLSFVVTRDYCNADCEERLHSTAGCCRVSHSVQRLANDLLTTMTDKCNQ